MSAEASRAGDLKRYFKPPLIGLIALALTMIGNPITHALVVWSKQTLGPANELWFYQILGAIVLLLLIWGIRRNQEASGTLIGWIAGLLLWTAYASYAFKFNPISLEMPAMSVTDGGQGRRPAYLFFIQGSIGICFLTLLFFVFNKDTKCDAFRWIQRMLRMNLGRPDSGQSRNFCRITFIETVYVIWFCYAVTLFLGDERFLGYHHPVTYGVFVGCAVWGLYLTWKLLRFTRLSAAIRWAIPTKAILWTAVGELAVKYGYYEEFWLHPFDYPFHMLGLGIVLLVLIGLAVIAPQRRQSTSEQKAS
ncbi:MAG: hypothetical protein NVV62_15850 [Terricaulis sp.]|nr:hypothetical protein [Terricaulis sp.]